MLRIVHIAPLVLCVLYANAHQDTTSVEDDSLATGLHIGRSGAVLQLGFLLPTRLQVLRVSSAYAVASIDGAPALSPAATIGLDFGSLEVRRLRHHSSAYQLRHTCITIGALSSALAFRDTTRVAVEGWRFGFHLASGHRFAAPSHSGLYLLHSGGWTWSYIRSGSSPTGDSALIARAEAEVESYRRSHFGANTAATIGYSIAGIVSVEASYQRVLLYKNHVFFPWLGSLLIEGIAQSLLGASLWEAEQRNPPAAAIATLILRSALSWGIYELRRTSGQHFPFGGNTPMFWDEFRIGMGLQF